MSYARRISRELQRPGLQKNMTRSRLDSAPLSSWHVEILDDQHLVVRQLRNGEKNLEFEWWCVDRRWERARWA